MDRIFLFLVLAVVSVPLMAQTKSAEASINDISKRLAVINENIYQNAEIKKELVCCNNQNNQIYSNTSKNPLYLPNLESIYHSVLSNIYNIKKDYENNPDIKIKGFDINLGFPPSVTISFEFKN